MVCGLSSREGLRARAITATQTVVPPERPKGARQGFARGASGTRKCGEKPPCFLSSVWCPEGRKKLRPTSIGEKICPPPDGANTLFPVRCVRVRAAARGTSQSRGPISPSRFVPSSLNSNSDQVSPGVQNAYIYHVPIRSGTRQQRRQDHRNARNTVHESGGMSYLVLPPQAVVVLQIKRLLVVLWQQRPIRSVGLAPTRPMAARRPTVHSTVATRGSTFCGGAAIASHELSSRVLPRCCRRLWW